MPGKIHRFFAFLLAPAVGFLLAFSQANPVDKLPVEQLTPPVEATGNQVAALMKQLDDTNDQLREAS
ncbi:MAG: phosphodiester glycosidase family protein, partial [Brevibacillus sp.]